MTNFKTQMMRSTALAGVASAMITVSASPAQAAIFNSLNNVQAAQAGSACRISWDVNVTGEPGDMVNNNDFYLRQITDLAGNQVPGTAGQTELQTIGVTSTFSLFVNVTIPPGTQRYDKFIRYTDFGGTGSSSIHTIIPDSVLQAAGGACLNLVANIAPTVDAGADASVAGQTLVQLSGTASDLENDPLTYLWTQVAGPAVTLTGSTTLTPVFTAPSKTTGPQTLTFSLAANDGMDTSTDTVDINVIGNVGPTANAGPDATVGGGTTGTLDGTGSTDGDGDPLTYSWTQTGGPAVTLTGANTATPTFTAPAATTVNQTLTFELEVDDGLARPSSDTVVITIPDNAAPVADAGQDVTATGGTTVTLSGSATDLENDPLTYQWTQTAGPSVVLGGANTLTPSFTAPAKTNAAQVLTFSLVANDGNSSSTADSVDITVAANAPPSSGVTAGGNVAGGGQFFFNASGFVSDPDGDPLTFQWTQISGPVATLSGANTATLSLTAPPKAATAQTMVFELALSDGLATTVGVTVDVNILPNQLPTANAGPDSTVGGGMVGTLDGSASADGDGDPLTYNWVQTGGPSVTLNGASTANPTFTAPAATTVNQTLTFELTVGDGIATASDVVEITIPDNAAPVVNAGPDATATSGTTVTLSGSATDLENDPLTYQWTQTSGPSVVLGGAATLTPSFTAPPKTAAAQVLTFSLVANDGNSSSTPDTVSITIPGNVGAIADAGPAQSVSGGSAVTLDGTGSTDGDGDPLTYIWTQTSGPVITLNGANTASPTFTAPAATAAVQNLTFSLTVSDGISTSAPAVVAVEVLANQVPIANAGADAAVSGGDTVVLDGSGSSDGDGDPLTYAWVQTSGTAVTLSDATNVSPSFTAPAAQTMVQSLTFDLVVSDGLTSSVADSVTITIAANAPPVANAGADQGPINSGASVTLNGGGSSDPDNDTLTYSWTQVSGPAVTLTGASTATPSFVAPDVQGLQDLVFQLIVNDGTVNSSPDTVTIGVRGVGTITIIQRVIGSDTSFAFASNIAALTGSISTNGGTGQRVATGVAAGAHNVTVADLSAAGYALTDISCNDSDSVANLASRTVALALSPNENLVCTFTSANSREAAVTAINNFLTGRNALIMSMQPDLQRRLDRLNPSQGTPGSATAYGLPVPGSGRLPFEMALGGNQARVSSSLSTAAAAVGDPDRGKQPFDIWTEAYFANARIGSQEGNFRIIHAGADYRVGKDLLLGVLAQFDDFNDKDTLKAGEAEGDGWMAGPYAMARLSPQLFGEVRAAWGKSDNRVSPLGTYIDAFKTSRSLYSGSLIGQFDLGEATQIRPEFTVRYLSEKAKAYTDSLNISIPGQTVDQGDISFRPRVQHLITLDGGWSLRPFGELEGIYTFGTGMNEVLSNGLRARVEGGVDVFSSGSFRSSLSAFHDGIGSDDFRSTGVHVAVSFGF